MTLVGSADTNENARQLAQNPAILPTGHRASNNLLQFLRRFGYQAQAPLN